MSVRHRSSTPQPHPAVLPYLRRFETPDMAQFCEWPQEALGTTWDTAADRWLRLTHRTEDLAWWGTQKKKKKNTDDFKYGILVNILWENWRYGPVLRLICHRLFVYCDWVHLQPLSPCGSTHYCPGRSVPDYQSEEGMWNMNNQSLNVYCIKRLSKIGWARTRRS